MIDAAKVLGEMIALLGGLGAFLGVYGLALLMMTLLALAFINAVSPTSRKVNFFLAMGVVSALAFAQALGTGAPLVQLERMLPYFLVMIAPYLLTIALTAAFRRATRPSEFDRMQRIENLTEELHREIEAMKKWG